LDARLSVAFLVAGIGFLTVATAAWAHAIGVACFFGFILAGYRAALPPDVVDARDKPAARARSSTRSGSR
jgi:hypothetical protein